MIPSSLCKSLHDYTAILWMEKLIQALLSHPAGLTLCIAEGLWVWDSGMFAFSHSYTCSVWQPGGHCGCRCVEAGCLLTCSFCSGHRLCVLLQEHGRQNHSDTGRAVPTSRLGTQLRKCPLQDARLQGNGGSSSGRQVAQAASIPINVTLCHKDKATVRNDMLTLQAEPNIPLVVQSPQHTYQHKYHI